MAKPNPNHSHDLNNNPPPSLPCPAISVIIPMYNAEKYIAECLDSLLAQTFRSFEVIVVDDCSTDNSPAIVESYVKKFGGRLILSHMEKNSGSGAMPRNKGMIFSRGEYIFFMDADDMFVPTALEEMYTLAKEYDAEVVQYTKNYVSDADGSNIRLSGAQVLGNKNDDTPHLESENLTERIEKILQDKCPLTPWRTLVQRNFLIENRISFPPVRIYEDAFWTYGLNFYAKRFLNVPRAVYINRAAADSMSRKNRPPVQLITHLINPVILGLKNLEQLMDGVEFFRQNPQYRYAVIEAFIKKMTNHFLFPCFQIPPFTVYEAIKQEFGSHLGEQDVLVSALCTYVNTLQRISVINQQKFNEFAKQAQNQVNEFNKFAAQAKRRIAELESQLK